jgi:hypothetical protein
LLWTGLLVCVLRGFTAQSSLWQLLVLRGLWTFPRVNVTPQAIYDRLKHVPLEPLWELFAQVTAVLRTRYAALQDLPEAAFATEIYVLDHCRLDAVLRKLALFRHLPRGDCQLLPGQLGSLWDVRRGFFAHVQYHADAQRNEKQGVDGWLQHLPKGALLLFDLGFYAFRWFDTLTLAGIYFVSRQRRKVSCQVLHVLYDGPAGPIQLRDRLVYLGAYRADRAGQPVRLIEVLRPTGTHAYLTNVLDPARLPAAHVVSLYQRRWDIESAFKLLKSHLNLFLLWSGHPRVVQLQVVATLLLAQVVLGLRNEVAQQARADLREVSLPLLLRWVPELAAAGYDPVRELVQRGRLAGIIRPFRGGEYELPVVAQTAYTLPAARPPPRRPRYAAKVGKHTTSRARPHTGQRKRAWGLRARKPRQA